MVKVSTILCVHERTAAHACGASDVDHASDLRVTLRNGRGRWHGREELLNEVVIFVFFAHVFSYSFITLRLIQWYHMDYFNDILSTFLCLERVGCFSVFGGSESCRISSRISSFVFQRWTNILRVWNEMSINDTIWLHFILRCPCNSVIIHLGTE